MRYSTFGLVIIAIFLIYLLGYLGIENIKYEERIYLYNASDTLLFYEIKYKHLPPRLIKKNVNPDILKTTCN